jgi:hypothetical protein
MMGRRLMHAFIAYATVRSVAIKPFGILAKGNTLSFLSFLDFNRQTLNG